MHYHALFKHCPSTALLQRPLKTCVGGRLSVTDADMREAVLPVLLPEVMKPETARPRFLCDMPVATLDEGTEVFSLPNSFANTHNNPEAR